MKHTRSNEESVEINTRDSEKTRKWTLNGAQIKQD